MATLETVIITAEEPKWILVGERLPKRNTSVIGYDEFYGRIGEARIVDWGKRDHLVFIDSDDCKITHWQPLPSPPQK